jgi:hypothetical protein
MEESARNNPFHGLFNALHSRQQNQHVQSPFGQHFQPGVRATQTASGNPSISMPLFRPSNNGPARRLVQNIQPSSSSLYSTMLGSMGSMGSMESVGSTGSAGSAGPPRQIMQIDDSFMQDIENDDQQRQGDLNRMRQSLGRGDSMARPFPSNRLQQGQPLFPALSAFASFMNNQDEMRDLEVTYAMMPGSNRPQVVNSQLINRDLNRDFGDPDINRANNQMFGNLFNLLRFVNHLPEEFVQNINMESLMEPVRVTVEEDDMKTFLAHYEYGNGSEEEKNIKIADQTKCAICLTDYKEADKVSYLQTCHHLFHEACIRKWLTEFNHKCPVCRLSANPDKNDSVPATSAEPSGNN